MPELSESDLRELNQNSYELLKELVTPEGIYASAAIGWEGPYHAWFGRDGAYTADFILAALEHGGDEALAAVAIRALENFARWQGTKDNPTTGERVGAIPHEIRKEFDGVDGIQHAARTNEKPWFVDPADNTLKNWDTADGTPLWTLVMLRGRTRLNTEFSAETETRLRSALNWICNNITQYDGLVGFTGADLQEGRVYSGLHNQGWKDTDAVYQRLESGNAPHPIKDVLVNAEAWAALLDGAAYFESKDLVFSQKLFETATRLQKRFNDTHQGFILPDRSGLAQAIDGNDEQLTQSAVDQGGVLWARTKSGEVCIDEDMVNTLVDKLLSPTMLNPEAGIRDYEKGTVFTHGTNYHGSPNTYWPFMSGVTARGMEQLGYDEAAKRVMEAFLNAIYTLGTNIEMFIQDEDDQFEPWSHPDPEIGQKSSRAQAWTAAAVYYATSYLLSEPKSADKGV